MLRSAVAAGFPLFSTQVFEHLGVQWAGTLLACLATMMIPIPVIFRIHGPALRGQSRMLKDFAHNTFRNLCSGRVQSSIDAKHQIALR